MHILTPTRVAHTYTQHLVAPPKAVFPLLCPVREADWIRDHQQMIEGRMDRLAEFLDRTKGTP